MDTEISIFGLTFRAHDLPVESYSAHWRMKIGLASIEAAERVDGHRLTALSRAG
jgi:hypothetical protein